MKLKHLFIALIGALSINVVTAQECAFDNQRSLQRQNPEFVQQEAAAEARIQSIIDSGNMTNRMGGVITVPVVVHVLHLGEAVGSGTNITDAQIQSSIDNLNDFYRGLTAPSPVDFEIQFALAQRDPNCMATTGINRIDASGVTNYSASGVSLSGGPGANQNTLKDLSRWPETDYFNVWIVTEINNNNGGAGFQGYANFYNGNAYEGSVMMYSVFGYDPTNANPSWPLNFARDNSTVSHEAGHYFHLYHTFQGDDANNDGVSDQCPDDSDVGNNGDGCADTVTHQRETSTCPATNACDAGNPWADNNTINNIMSYYSCTDLMTNDQKTRVRAAMEGTSLANSKGGDAVDPTYMAPVAVCSNNSTATNSAGILGVELNGVSFTSFSSASDGGNIDDSGNCSNFFEIDATVANTVNVTMFPSNVQQLGIWIDWNDDGDFNDDAEKQHYSGSNAASSVVPVILTYPASIPYGDYVRIRLLTELSTIYGASSIDDLPCDTTLNWGQSEDYAIYVEPNAGPTTYTYNNGWAPSDPTGVALATDMIDVVAGDITLTANTSCDELTVEGGASVTINSGVTMTTTTVELNSTSSQYSSMIVNGTLVGTVNYNRYAAQVGPVGSNDLISSPLSGQTFGAFETANANLPASGTIRAFAPYNTATGDFENYDATANSGTAIGSGTGYRTASTDGSALIFTGTVLSSDVLNVPISDAAAGNAWNLIGNPYPSYIDFSTFFAANQAEFDSASAYQAIYGYDGDASNGWTVWNQATILDNSITEILAPGQAFFVKAKTGGGQVDFTTAMRTTGNDDDFISGRSANDVNLALSKLTLTSTTNSAYTSIYFIDNMTRGLDDGYDAGSYQGVAGEFSIFTNLVEDNEGLDIAIQSLAYGDLNDVVIPLGVKAVVEGEMTIALDATSSLPQGINVYLEDTLLNTLTLLNDSDYVFTPEGDLTGIGRFFLRYAEETLTVLDAELDNVVIYMNNQLDDIVIKGQLNSTDTAVLYDIQGRMVVEANLEPSNNMNTINVEGLSAGVYIIKLSDDNSITKTQKLVIR